MQNSLNEESPSMKMNNFDIDQYIIQRNNPQEWNLTGLEDVPMNNNNSKKNIKLASEPNTPICNQGNKSNNIINTESTCSNLLKSTASPFWYANRIVLPKLPNTVKHTLTPFQVLQQRFKHIKNIINERKNNYLNKNCNLRLTNIYSKETKKMEEELKQQVKIKKIKLKRIGSYSNIYYNKLELKKVDKMRNMNGLPDTTFRSGLIKLSKRENGIKRNQKKCVCSNLKRSSMSCGGFYIPTQLIITKLNNNNSCISNKNNSNSSFVFNNSVSRNSREFDSHLSGFQSSSVYSNVSRNKKNNNLNYFNTSQTQNDFINKSEYQLKGNKKYL